MIEVLALAQNVCRDQDPEFLIRRDLVDAGHTASGMSTEKGG
ncbi:MAG: hypothetical protein ACREYF_17880 [Gammaproteobacteria bacterium]